MAITLQRESTEFVFIGVTGVVPSGGAEVAFLSAEERPTTEWKAAIVVADDGHALWADAQASGATGDYFIARLVGAFGGNDLTLIPGDYQSWLRLSDVTEQPVRIAPVALTVD